MPARRCPVQALGLVLGRWGHCSGDSGCARSCYQPVKGPILKPHAVGSARPVVLSCRCGRSAAALACGRLDTYRMLYRRW